MSPSSAEELLSSGTPYCRGSMALAVEEMEAVEWVVVTVAVEKVVA